jgi:hypothetical protein
MDQARGNHHNVDELPFPRRVVDVTVVSRPQRRRAAGGVALIDVEAVPGASV